LTLHPLLLRGLGGCWPISIGSASSALALLGGSGTLQCGSEGPCAHTMRTLVALTPRTGTRAHTHTASVGHSRRVLWRRLDCPCREACGPQAPCLGLRGSPPTAPRTRTRARTHTATQALGDVAPGGVAAAAAAADAGGPGWGAHSPPSPSLLIALHIHTQTHPTHTLDRDGCTPHPPHARSAPGRCSSSSPAPPHPTPHHPPACCCCCWRRCPLWPPGAGPSAAAAAAAAAADGRAQRACCQPRRQRRWFACWAGTSSAGSAACSPTTSGGCTPQLLKAYVWM